MLLDEPFSALDSTLRADLRADVRSAVRADGTTAVLVTHDQQEALATADLVAVLRDGRVVQRTTEFSAASLVAAMPPRSALTPAVRWAPAIERGLALIGLLHPRATAYLVPAEDRTRP